MKTFDILTRFQKIVDITNGVRTIGYESTIRGVSGEPAPEVFSRARDSNRMVELDRECRWRAVAESKDILRGEDLLFINISNYSLENGRISFPIDVIPERTVLEITEHDKTTEELIRVLRRMHSQGFKLAIDDFGSGYCNLDLYIKLPVTFVKLDNQFVRALPNVHCKSIIRNINEMCLESGRILIVEGVETVEQMAFLKNIGVRMMQGFYFDNPMTVADRLKEINWFV